MKKYITLIIVGVVVLLLCGGACSNYNGMVEKGSKTREFTLLKSCGIILDNHFLAFAECDRIATRKATVYEKYF